MRNAKADLIEQKKTCQDTQRGIQRQVENAMNNNREIMDALSIYIGRNMRFVIFPAFPGEDQVNTQKLVISGVVKEIVEADGGWGKGAQVVFEGGSTFLFQSYQTIWEIEVNENNGSLDGYQDLSWAKEPNKRSSHKVIVEIGPAW